MNIIIIGSSRGIRKIDPVESFPSVLQKINQSQETLLDLILGIIKKEKKNKIYFLGGYHIEKVIKSYPELKFYYNPNWKKENFLDIFNIINISANSDTLIFDSSILLKNSFFNELRKSRSNLSYKFFLEKNKNKLKILFIKKKFIGELKRFFLKKNNLSEKSFIKHIIQKIPNSSVFNKNLFINIEDFSNPSSFLLGTKADTLFNMKNILKKSNVLDQFTFTQSQWSKDKKNILKQIAKIFKNKKLIIRSSSIFEDRLDQSNAGMFESILNIKNDKFLEKHIESILKNYKLKKYSNSNNQVLIQEFLTNVKVSGVVLTTIQKDSSPYYLINFDDTSNKTDTVTSGNTSSIKSIYIYKNSKSNLYLKNWQKKLIKSIKEIESKVNLDSLDIEFAVDKNKVHIFQVRPLKQIKNRNYHIDDFDLQLSNIKFFINNHKKKQKKLYGNTNIFSNMSDWNPAEMIGPTPLPLSFSLYKNLITDIAWSISRYKLGYKYSFIDNLIYSFCGLPYVDIRKSLNSFLIPTLSDNICNKLINSELKYLKSKPHLNDKLEFKVAINCYSYDRKNYLDHLEKNLRLTKTDSKIILNKYKKWTSNLIINSKSIFKNLDKQYKNLDKIVRLKETKKPNINEYFEHLKDILRFTRNYGAIPFGISARYGFISLSILQTMMNLNIFSKSEYYEFLSNIPTVSSEFSSDLNNYFYKKINKKILINRYGHLRPSSYDMNSQSYKSLLIKNFFTKSSLNSNSINSNINNARFIWLNKKNLINKWLKKENTNFNSSQLFHFIINGIKGREYGKFQYSKGLNAILEVLNNINNHSKMKEIDINFLKVEDLIHLSSDTFINLESLRSKVNVEKKKYNISKSIKLNEIVFSTKDVDIISSFKHQPNFITNKSVSGKIVYLTNNTKPDKLENKIVFIESADPGYDWIFSSKIRGLVTMYGGMASHMAIRSAEYGLASVIGCGEEIFNQFSSGEKILIDSDKKIIKKI